MSGIVSRAVMHSAPHFVQLQGLRARSDDPVNRSFSKLSSQEFEILFLCSYNPRAAFLVFRREDP